MQKEKRRILIWIAAALVLIAAFSLALRGRGENRHESNLRSEDTLPDNSETRGTQTEGAAVNTGEIEAPTKKTRPSLAPPTKAVTTNAETSAETTEAETAARKTRPYLPPPTKGSAAPTEQETSPAETLPEESSENAVSSAEETEVVPQESQGSPKPADDELIAGLWKLDQDLSSSLDALVASKFGPQYVPEGQSVKFSVRVLITAEKAYLRASEAEVQDVKDAVHEYLMAVYALSSENASSPLEKAAVLSWVIAREGLYTALSADLLNQLNAWYQLANQRIYLGNYTTEDDGLDMAYAFSEDGSILILTDLRTERQEYAAVAEMFRENFGLTPPFSLERIE